MLVKLGLRIYKMKKVCIVVGHSFKDGGAYNETFGMNEYGYNHPPSQLIGRRAT